jgi:hypothetical protein
MDLVVKEKLVLEERRISLSEFHTADEVSFYYFIFFIIYYFLGFLLCKYPMKFRLGTLVTYKELMGRYMYIINNVT